MAFGGTNLDRGHAYNRQLVLEAIRVHGALSRADLTRLTGLAPQTISNICASLAKSGMLVTERRRANSKGQPPTDLRLNPHGGCAFGISLDGSRMYAVLVDLAGNVLNELEEHLDDTGPDAAVNRIAAAVEALRQSAPVPDERIFGTGIAMTGLTTNGSFIGLAPDHITSQWSGFPLDRELRSALSMPIFTDNDARAAAVGEVLYGRGRSARDFLYIYFGVGVGGGIIHAGQPFRGSRGRAGEFGHIVVEPGGRPCPCGNRGCLEQYVSMASATAALRQPVEGTVEQRLIAGLEGGDPGLLDWIDAAAVHLRTAIVSLENIFDPEMVLLGGIVPEPLLDAIYERILPLPRSVASRDRSQARRLIKSHFGPAIPAMGAASLALFEATSADLSLLFKRNGVPIPHDPAGAGQQPDGR
jgi:predicted NBD/HSP70 family sugar kinase